ncbi:hypothetical protein [Nostoc sp. CMAA1605]|uniref:hypothetical protein n=1 Tax=Nostoc sp. CMAA1605 TaxID=2055159 RepID=UPI001F3A955F|nr:hypothetical protein [Nostoc sp. CMAA1605]
MSMFPPLQIKISAKSAQSYRCKPHQWVNCDRLHCVFYVLAYLTVAIADCVSFVLSIFG